MRITSFVAIAAVAASLTVTSAAQAANSNNRNLILGILGGLAGGYAINEYQQKQRQQDGFGSQQNTLFGQGSYGRPAGFYQQPVQPIESMCTVSDGVKVVRIACSRLQMRPAY